MILTDNIKKFIMDHSKEIAPFECVGVVFKKNDNIQIKKLKSLFDHIKNYAAVEWDTVLEAVEGGEVLALYHSHVNSDEFSPEDKAASEKFGSKIIMYCIEKRSFKVYEPSGFTAPYVGRLWAWGLFTCINLVEDFYKKELKITIKGFEDKNLLTVNASSDLYLRYFLKNDFVETKGLKKYDLILNDYDLKDGAGILTNCSIYLGDEKFLQQNHFEKSCIRKLTNKEKLLFTCVLRHKSLL